ncbi:MAG: hypothetical protein ACJA0C_001340 [Candidatus Endobugula sp.]
MKIQASNLRTQRRNYSHCHGSSSPSPRLIRLQASLCLWIIIRIIHCLALLAVWSTSLPFIWQLILSLVIVLSLILALFQHSIYPSFRLHCRQDGWYLLAEKIPFSIIYERLRGWFCRVGFWHTGGFYRIVSGSYLSTFLVVVCVEDSQGRQRYIPVFSDCCQQDEFRWLRVVIQYLL